MIPGTRAHSRTRAYPYLLVGREPPGRRRRGARGGGGNGGGDDEPRRGGAREGSRVEREWGFKVGGEERGGGLAAERSEDPVLFTPAALCAAFWAYCVFMVDWAEICSGLS